MPYIDLVCELLEAAISPDTGVDFTGVLSDGADPLKGRISNDLLTALQAARFPVTDHALILETESITGASATQRPRCQVSANSVFGHCPVHVTARFDAGLH